MKQILSVLLLTLSLLLLFSCNRNTDTECVPDDNRSVVFRGEEIALPDGWSVTASPAMTLMGDTLTLKLQMPIEVDEYGWGTYDNSAAQFRYAEGSLVFDAFSAGGTGGIVLSDGTIATVEKQLDEYTQTMALTVFSGDDELFCVNPAEAMGYHLARDVGDMSGSGFAVLDAVSYVTDAETLYVILTTEGLCAYHADGTQAFAIRDANEPAAVIVTDGHLLYLNRNQEGIGTLRLVDITTGKLSDTIPLPETLVGNAGGVQPKLIGGAGYDLYAYNSTAIYGVDVTFSDDGTHASTATPVLDWLESGIRYANVRAVCMIDAETAVVAMQDGYGMYIPGTLSLYRMIPADEVPQKEEIVIASLCNAVPISDDGIIAFNLSSDTHKFIIRDYGTYPVDRRKLAFDTDLAAGLIPDVVLIEEDLYNVTGFLAAYENTDLFCDLKPLMQADADFNYDGLLSYVTAPYEQNGEQRIFPISWSLNMTYARESSVGGVMTPDEYLSYAQRMLSDDNRSLHSHLSTWFLCYGVIGERYDMAEGTCNFADPRFAAWIDTAASLGNGAEITEDIDSKELFRQGKICFYEQYLPSTLYMFVTMMHDLGAQNPGDIIPVGYPNESGQLTASSGGGVFFAVTAASEYKAECIDLLQSHINERRDGDSPEPLYDGGTIYYQADVEKQLAFFDGKTVVNENRISAVVTDEEAESMTGVKIKITREWADAYTAMLDSITRRTTGYRVPEQIFFEELRAQTGKTTEEVLSAVQSRVSLYLSEQFG